ncbi:MAG: DNA polymerase III subunit delta [Treponema sp.]|nr:DNA polymerase III subunit delta [Treponema sp.]
MAESVPLYLYTGPEFGKRNDAVDAIKAAHKKKFGVIDEHSFYLLETPFSQVMTILQSGTLFSDGVCVVCRNAELIKKKEDIQMIADWLENPDASAVLILISDEISVDAKLEKLVPPANRKKFWEMFESDKLPWVLTYFSKNGYRIQQPAARLVLELIENNTQALANECSRFFVLFPKDHEITEDDVDSVLTHNREENAFSLFRELANSSENSQLRFEKGLQILQKIRLSKENSSVMIIAGLSSCFKNLILWHKEGENAIHGKLLQNQYRSAAKVWSKGQAAAILAVLASTDMEIRSGGSTMEDILLQKMLYEIVIKNGAQLSTLSQEY